MLYQDFKALVQDATFPGWEFGVSHLDEGLYALEGRFKAPCAVTGGDPVWQYTRKWIVQGCDTPAAVLGTLLKCVLTAVEHEAREHFKWRGVVVFDPHGHIPALGTPPH